LNVAATAGLACVAVRGWPAAGVLVRMLGVMFCAQCAIGVTNDYFDSDLDAATKPWKPVAAGLVSPRAALALAVAFGVAATALAATLGVAGFALAMLGMACGLAYDIRLKRSALSAVPYMLAIPVLPLWVWATIGAWRPVLLWLLPLGALIGLALHLANTLPDLDSDSAQGLRGMAHRLGAPRSMQLVWVAFAGALALSAVLTAVVAYDLRFYLPAAGLGVAALAGSAGVYAIRRDESALQLGFGVLSLASAVLAVGWLAAVT
jgi:4-hydroxybenzoate polyprenyltransferase